MSWKTSLRILVLIIQNHPRGLWQINVFQTVCHFLLLKIFGTLAWLSPSNLEGSAYGIFGPRAPEADQGFGGGISGSSRAFGNMVNGQLNGLKFDPTVLDFKFEKLIDLFKTITTLANFNPKQKALTLGLMLIDLDLKSAYTSNMVMAESNGIFGELLLKLMAMQHFNPFTMLSNARLDPEIPPPNPWSASGARGPKMPDVLPFSGLMGTA